MRISDWRSDVCSSDRLALKMADQGGNILGAAGQAGDLKHNHAEPEEQVFAELAIGARGAQILVRRRNDADINAAQDRKNVVLGKGGSGRLDPGGRRTSKKNNTNEHENYHNKQT